ncbi:MAG: alcohol dehydrogenase [Woeseia sp.]|nr:alcohol dehydrogenase [Woeseia sp.]|tara:strand:+ start:3734 stop:4885 length:1152 start_codon:yes stop_codon:yes gene_type:complete
MPKDEIVIHAAVANTSDDPFVTEQLLLAEPRSSEIRVRIVSTSICHTDIITKNKGLCSFPIVLGHEATGIVDALGDAVTGFALGDHVILSYDYCGNCVQCREGKPSYCDEHGDLNFSGTRPDGIKTHRRAQSDTPDIFGSFFQQSSFATYALSHMTNTIKVDKSLPLTLLAPLGCGVQTGAGTVFNTLQVKKKSSLAVFGCGCVGLSAIMAAKSAGAATITAIDINPKRLEVARELGATHAIRATDYADDSALVEAVKSFGKASGYHYAIDTSGVPSVLRQATECCGPLGVTAMIAPGVPGTEVCLQMLDLLPGKSLRGVIQGDAVSKNFIPKLIDLWQAGSFPFDKLITKFEGLDSLDSAVRAMNSGEVIKPVIIIDEAFSD